MLRAHVGWFGKHPGHLAIRCVAEPSSTFEGNVMWQDDLRYLGSLGWDAEDIERACEILAPSFEDEDLSEFSPPGLREVRQKLGGEFSQREVDALLVLSRLHDRIGGDAEALRAALRDFERFVNDES